MTSSTIRYKYIKCLVNDIYIKLNLDSYPINIFKIISCYKNIRVISYSQFMKKYNLSKKETLDNFTSEEGCTDYLANQNKYIIYYNDLNNSPQGRINWTIAHELGHILCNHHNNSRTKLFKYELSEIEYEAFEKEANYFASMLLAHSAILLQLDIHNSYEIEVFCNLSKQASKYRYDNYIRYKKLSYSTSSDRYIIRNFQNYINSKNEDYREHLLFINSFNKRIYKLI